MKQLQRRQLPQQIFQAILNYRICHKGILPEGTKWNAFDAIKNVALALADEANGKDYNLQYSLIREAIGVNRSTLP